MIRITREGETISFNTKAITSIACEKDDETDKYKLYIKMVRSTGTVVFECDDSNTAKKLFENVAKQIEEDRMLIPSDRDTNMILNPRFVTKITLHKSSDKNACHVIFETVNTLDSHVITYDTIEKGQELFEQCIEDIEQIDNEAKFVKVEENNDEIIAINIKFVTSITCERNTEENNWCVEIGSVHSIFPDKFTFETEDEAKQFFQNILEQLRD